MARRGGRSASLRLFEGTSMARKKTTLAASGSRPVASKARQPKSAPGVHVYTLETFLIGGPVTQKFAKKNPVVSRTILIRGDQTLEDLHQALFDAYGREEEHMYEFQLGGQGPMDPKAKRYVLPMAFGNRGGLAPAGRIHATTLDSLRQEE
jgi:hypothetical protein